MSRAEAWAREAQAAVQVLADRPTWTHRAEGTRILVSVALAALEGGGAVLTAQYDRVSGVCPLEVTISRAEAVRLAAFLAHWFLEDPEPTVVYHCGVRQEATP